MSNFIIEKMHDFIGFCIENSSAGSTTVPILTRSILTSDDSRFYKFMESISELFFNNLNISNNEIYKFIILQHSDGMVNLYINDFKVIQTIRSKNPVILGQTQKKDVIDIIKINFPEINIVDTDKIIYCVKIGWKFGLFFDLDRHNELLSIEDMKKIIGSLHRYLSFQFVYETFESQSESLYQNIFEDGWFPFVEIINQYKIIIEAYKDRFDFNNKINSVIEIFNQEKITEVTDKWWTNSFFNEKKLLINAGIDAFLQNNHAGFINCEKTLSSELEGILRKVFYDNTLKGNRVKINELLEHIKSMGVLKFGSEYSLLLPTPFFNYLNEIIFKNFDLEAGSLDLSRHTAAHGLADSDSYTKARALQLILTLDQLYYFIK